MLQISYQHEGNLSHPNLHTALNNLLNFIIYIELFQLCDIYLVKLITEIKIYKQNCCVINYLSQDCNLLACNVTLPIFHQVVKSVFSTLETRWTLWLLWPKECGKSDILRRLNPDLKSTGSFLFQPLGALTLRTFHFRTQLPCCEKTKSHGEAMCWHFYQQPLLSTLLTGSIILHHVNEPSEQPAQSSLQRLQAQLLTGRNLGDNK